MKTPAALLLVFLLSGCVAPTGQGSRLLPWNWFHPDANAAIAKADARKVQADAAAITAAHIETEKAEEALTFAPPSPPVEFARRTLAGGNGLLAQVATLSAEQRAISRQIVVDLFSGIPAKMDAANRQQTKVEAQTVKVSRELTDAGEKVDAAQAGLLATNLSNSTDAAKYRKLWFWIWVVAGGWLFLQLLAGIARFYPTFGPVARIAGFLSAPAVQASYERVTSGISKAVMDAEVAGSAVVSNLRAHLDGPLDETEKKVIHAKVLTAKKKAAAVANG